MTSNNHVQAEALAAWAEGRLAAAESATVEAHLASCAVCQEMLAVFARTQPQTRPVPSVVSGSWFRWQWAVPVAAAATAAAIWVAVPDNPSQGEFERTVAPAIEERAAAPRASAADAAAKAEDARQLSSRRDAASSTLEDRAEKHAPTVQERDQDVKAEAGAAAAPTAARAPEAPAADQVRFRAETLTAVQREAATTEALSPDPLVRWRIVAPGRLERSTDGGKTWEPVPLPQPANDLVAVRAPTATSAIVTAADGRQYGTDDQGKTWNPVQP